MKLIPWRKVEDWVCLACGICCKEFRVPLSMHEATKLAMIFGHGCLEVNWRGYYLKKTLDRRCMFQVNLGGKLTCGIQEIKPLACKLWPFTVLREPRYGARNEALYEFKGQGFYVYLNPYCRGIIYGRPSERFERKVIQEFIELSIGLRVKQELSTSPFISLMRSITPAPRKIIINEGAFYDHKATSIIMSLPQSHQQHYFLRHPFYYNIVRI